MDHLIDDNDRLETCPFCGAEAEIISIAGETDDINTGAQCVQCTSSACGASSALIYPLMDDVTNLLMELWNKRRNARSKEWPERGFIMASDLDLDDVAATSSKAKAELEALRAENARLRARISDLQKQISNDQHPPYSAPDPDRFY